MNSKEQRLELMISESTFMYFQKPFENLNLTLFEFDIVENINFEILYAYSYDKKSWSRFVSKPEDYIIDTKFPLYVCIWLRRIILTDTNYPETLHPYLLNNGKPSGYSAQINATRVKNVDIPNANSEGQKLPTFSCKSIKYNNKEVLECDVRFEEYFNIIDEFPRWNLYDNQTIAIKRWLAQCNSIAEQYGHTVIWFKTTPVSKEPGHDSVKIYREDYKQSGIHGTHVQLANHVIRDITDIKKLHVMLPNNEIPQDRNIFSEWDMALQDEIIMHVVREKFEQAFGIGSVPEEKDFLYFPMINKLFRVSTMQPKNGFMGVIGWYEVFLSKYEEDDTVVNSKANQVTTDRKTFEKYVINKDLKDSISGIPEMFEGLEQADNVNNIDVYDSKVLEAQDNLWDEFSEMKKDVVLNNLGESTADIQEQRKVTEDYSNRLEDTTFYVSLKETEKLREFYHKRLNIVSVTPNSHLPEFALNMYDCSKVESHTVALQYAIRELLPKRSEKSIQKSFDFSFGFVITGVAPNIEIFKLALNDGNSVIFKTRRNQMFLEDSRVLDVNTNICLLDNEKFERNELYKIQVSYQLEKQLYVIKVYRLEGRTEKLLDSNVVRVEINPKNQEQLRMDKIQLFGGNFLINNVQIYIDGSSLLDDKCLPLLKTYKF